MIFSVLLRRFISLYQKSSTEEDMQFNGWHTVKWLLTILVERTLTAASLLQKDSFQKSVQRHNTDVVLMS